MAPTGQLAQQAVAGGYESVRHMLNSIEGESPDVMDLEFDDEDNNQDDEEDENNVKEVSYINKQNDLVIKHENDNVPDEAECIDSDEQCNSGNNEGERVTEIKESHEMIIDKLYKQLLSED